MRIAPKSLRLHFIDHDARVAAALSKAFEPFPEVSVSCDNILRVAHHLVVSPANSQGFMDGGVDRAYAAFFGDALVRRVRDAVLCQPEGFLPVGAAIVIPTGRADIPHLILAPTMSSPEHVPPANAYRALRAALRLSHTQDGLAGDWFCPGLTTLVGGVEPSRAASEMAEAYRDWRAK